MGNSCLCMGRGGSCTAAGVVGKKKRKQRGTAAAGMMNGLRAAAPRRADVVVPVTDTAAEYESMRKKWVAARCSVDPAAGGGEEGARAVVRMKVVMTRKAAGELMARLEERAAAERKNRMGDLKAKLRGGGSLRCASWRPRLRSIPEN